MRRLAVLLAAVLLAAWLALAPTAAEPPADAFVEAVPLGDFSEGLAFAHITRPDGTRQTPTSRPMARLPARCPKAMTMAILSMKGMPLCAHCPGPTV